MKFDLPLCTLYQDWTREDEELSSNDELKRWILSVNDDLLWQLHIHAQIDNFRRPPLL